MMLAGAFSTQKNAELSGSGIIVQTGISNKCTGLQHGNNFPKNASVVIFSVEYDETAPL